MKRMNKQAIDTEANKLFDLWIMHYGGRNADKLSKRLRRKFIKRGKNERPIQ
jgi:hypothetical protein